MTIKETVSRVPRFWKNTAAVVGVLSGLAGVYAATNTVMGVEIRPAWAWEVAELNRNQLQTQMQLEQINRRDFMRRLNEYRAMREEMRRNGDTIPAWLTQEISDGEEDIRQIDSRIRAIQDKLINQ